MTQARTHRIESEIQRVLSVLIAREVKDPRVGNVTITGVSVATDMGSARVFFTPFASQNQPAQVRNGLTHAAGFLRGELGRRLGLRHAPRLEFVFDDSVEGAARLTHLIDRAVARDHAGAAAARTADEDVAGPSEPNSGVESGGGADVESGAGSGAGPGSAADSDPKRS